MNHLISYPRYPHTVHKSTLFENIVHVMQARRDDLIIEINRIQDMWLKALGITSDKRHKHSLGSWISDTVSGLFGLCTERQYNKLQETLTFIQNNLVNMTGVLPNIMTNYIPMNCS